MKESRLQKSVVKNGKVAQVSLAKAASNAIDLMGVAKQFRRNDKLFSDGDNAKYIYKVESGCIKTYNVLKDDRRHIRAFHLAGDYIGLEENKRHDCIADAIAPSVVRLIDKKTLLARVNTDIGLLKYLLAVTAAELMRAREHKALLLMSAESRVARFLLEVAGRDSRRGAIGMPLVRQELADHLGLTFETVSRILWRLERSKIISLPERHSAVIKNTMALKRMSA